jgi:hypothetical protein
MIARVQPSQTCYFCQAQAIHDRVIFPVLLILRRASQQRRELQAQLESFSERTCGSDPLRFQPVGARKLHRRFVLNGGSSGGQLQSWLVRGAPFVQPMLAVHYTVGRERSAAS